MKCHRMVTCDIFGKNVQKRNDIGWIYKDVAWISEIDCQTISIRCYQELIIKKYRHVYYIYTVMYRGGLQYQKLFFAIICQKIAFSFICQNFKLQFWNQNCEYCLHLQKNIFIYACNFSRFLKFFSC
jgi:hypothetical protein